MPGAKSGGSDARRLETELAQQHELLRVTLQSIGDGVITTDAQGLVGWLNPAAERMTGWRSAEACGRPAQEVFRIVDVVSGLAVADQLSDCLTHGRESRLAADRDLMSRDGTRAGIEDIAAPIRNEDGQIFGAVLVFRDVTEQRRIEAGRAEREQELRVINTELERLARHLAKARDSADRANKAKSRFLAGMSHELRTPLNGILGYAQLLRLEGGLGEKQQARVAAMLAAGSHLLEMVNSVLGLSEIEAERVELRALDVDLREIVAACVDQVRPTAVAKQLVLRITVAPGSPRVITTDPVRLRQVLLNLLGNAVKFTTGGSIDLRMGPVTGGSAVRIEVIDTGPGIPPDQREHLFVEFERLGAGGVETVEGAGLGLALSARLVVLMGGRLGYQDNPGGGSIFWLELPPVRTGQPGAAARPAVTALAPAETGTVVGGAAADPPGALSVASLRVLVVDDMAMNRDIARSFLKVAGHEATCAESGADAIAAVLAGSFDVVLMDVRMPGMDGLEATRRIRALDGPVRNIPIVGLTAQAFAEQVQECRLAGMDGHLSKPYGPVALMAAMAAAIDAGRNPARIPDFPAANHKETSGGSVMAAIELPVIDRDLADRLASILPAEVIHSYLQSTAARGEAVLSEMERWKPSDGSEVLADSIHALTGSAGMFGFAWLTDAGRRFERALRAGSTEAPDLGTHFRSAIEATLQSIRNR